MKKTWFWGFRERFTRTITMSWRNLFVNFPKISAKNNLRIKLTELKMRDFPEWALMNGNNVETNKSCLAVNRFIRHYSIIGKTKTIFFRKCNHDRNIVINLTIFLWKWNELNSNVYYSSSWISNLDLNIKYD